LKDGRQKKRGLSKIYDAVFQGRFHPQKGVVELIEIWRRVVEKIPEAKLVMIGDGPLMKNVKLKIKNLKLESNIELLGYVFDGDEKYKTFSQSKIVVHPALYDSGGMASAEAMAFGLPCVGFNLKSYISYYPKGMIKVKVGDLNAFSDTIIRLLRDERFRNRIGGEAENVVKKDWSWEKRSEELLNKFI
jgi:glycosyltransferase involved in cell wall biosynthesis